MAENHHRSHPPRARTPELFLLPSPHSSHGARTHLTPSALLLRLTYLQAALQRRPRWAAALFLLTFGVHGALWPAGLAPDLAPALALWSVFLLATTTAWTTACVLAPVWISLAFRVLAGALPAFVAPVYALWALSVYGWLAHPKVRAYASGEWALAEEAARIRRALAGVEASVADFAASVLTHVFRADLVAGRMVERARHRRRREHTGTLWTEERLVVLRPVGGDRKAVWPEFDGFVAAAKSEIASLSAEVERLNRVRHLARDEMVYRERVRVYVETTLAVWEGLYAELMHPLGKGETSRPEVGERLPRRVVNAIKWFEAVEDKGIEVVVVDEEET